MEIKLPSQPRDGKHTDQMGIIWTYQVMPLMPQQLHVSLIEHKTSIEKIRSDPMAPESQLWALAVAQQQLKCIVSAVNAKTGEDVPIDGHPASTETLKLAIVASHYELPLAIAMVALEAGTLVEEERGNSVAVPA